MLQKLAEGVGVEPTTPKHILSGDEGLPMPKPSKMVRPEGVEPSRLKVSRF
jgi:hypothetical protein